MAGSARIDELRKKFDENPRRYFAPLANEYRKAGDLEQAIFICQEYLPQQPGHMSGHIVYGQALFDLNRHEEAKSVFETALTLDPENLIALRHLGDIARQSGDVGSARSWYQRVLEADPRNEEIAGLIASMNETATAPAPEPMVPEPVAQSDRPVSEVDPMAPTPISTPAVSATAAPLVPEPLEESFEIEKSTEASVSAAAAQPEPAVAAEPATDDGLLEMGDMEIGGQPMGAASDVSRPPSAKEHPAGLPAVEAHEASTSAPGLDDLLDAGDFDVPGTSAAMETAVAPAREAAPEIDLAGDIAIGLPDDGIASPSITAAGEPSLSLDGLQTFEAGVLSDAPAETISLETESFYDLPPVGQSEPHGSNAESELPPAHEESEAAEAPEVFVTETMATLYMQQGHVDSAIDIYRRLVEQRPDDASLRERLAAVEAQRAGSAPAATDEAEDVGDIASAADADGAGSFESAEETPAPAPRTFGGPTIRDFLGGILARRPQGTAAGMIGDVPLAEVSDEAEQFLSVPAAEPVDDSFEGDLVGGNDGAQGYREEAQQGDRQETHDADDETWPVDRGGEPPHGDVLPVVETPVESSVEPSVEPRATPSSSETVGGSLDILFSGADAAAGDREAAQTLSDAFPDESVDATPLRGMPARRASDELSLNHVFKAGTPPRPADEDGFSFDQFFEKSAAEGATPAVDVGGAGEAEATDDIAQFNAWLNGLKKT